MYKIKGIENPSKSEVIGHCGGDEKRNDHAEKSNSKKKKKDVTARMPSLNNNGKFDSQPLSKDQSTLI